MDNGQIQLYFRFEKQAKISGEPRSQPEARQKLQPAIFPMLKPENQGALWRQAFLLLFGLQKVRRNQAQRPIG
jgi:hypothetical protein